MDITTVGRVMLAEHKALFLLAECVYSGWLSKERAKKTKTSVIIAFSSRIEQLVLGWSRKAYGITLSSMIKIASCYNARNAYIMDTEETVVERPQFVQFVQKHTFRMWVPNTTSLSLNRSIDAP